jgi:hypothetical protein
MPYRTPSARVPIHAASFHASMTTGEDFFTHHICAADRSVVSVAHGTAPASVVEVSAWPPAPPGPNPTLSTCRKPRRRARWSVMIEHLCDGGCAQSRGRWLHSTRPGHTRILPLPLTGFLELVHPSVGKPMYL